MFLKDFKKKRASAKVENHLKLRPSVIFGKSSVFLGFLAVRCSIGWFELNSPCCWIAYNLCHKFASYAISHIAQLIFE